MIGLTLLSLMLLALSDPMIRRSKDSLLRRIWLKLFKKPIVNTVIDFQKSLHDKMVDKYGKDKKTGSIDFDKMFNILSDKYVYYIVIFALLLFVLSFIPFFIK